jgi:hypothetical protein
MNRDRQSDHITKDQYFALIVARLGLLEFDGLREIYRQFDALDAG